MFCLLFSFYRNFSNLNRKNITALSGSRFTTLALIADGTLEIAGQNIQNLLGDAEFNYNPNYVRRYLDAEESYVNLNTPYNLRNKYNYTICSGDTCHLILRPSGSIGLGSNCHFQSKVTTAASNSPLGIAGGSGNGWVLNGVGQVTGWGWNYHWHVGTRRYYLENGITKFIRCNTANLNNPPLYDFRNMLPLPYEDQGSYQEPLDEARSIFAGLRHTTILNNNGQITSWGSNIGGELCSNDKICSYVNPSNIILYTRDDEQWNPSIDVQNGEGVVTDGNNMVYAVAVTTNKGCTNHDGESGYKALKYPSYAITSFGRVVGWGANQTDKYQLTAKHEINQIYTSAMYIHKNYNEVLDNVVAVAAGQGFGVALDANGKLWIWGNFNPLLFPTQSYQYATPILVEKLLGTNPDGSENVEIIDVRFKSISASGYADAGNYITALTSDGNIYTMGDNRGYQCGRISSTEFNTRLRIIKDNDPNFTNSSLKKRVKAIDNSPKTSIALRADGTVWSWGGNRYGQFGN